MGRSLRILDAAREPHNPACSTPALNISSPGEGVAPVGFRGRAAVVTLGCAKNQVDSEVMLGVLAKSGFEIVTDLGSADVAVVNTCGFLESAVRESIDCILEVAERKRSGRLRKLIVAGCMVSRYKGDLCSEFPEVDSFVSVDDVLKVAEAAGGEFKAALDEAARPYFLYDDTMPRFLSTRSHTAYVKISEGCNRPCAFCIIPQIKGEMRSRSIDSVVREVSMLGEQGVREVNLVAQDLTAYGSDIKGPRLAELLRALDSSGAVDWIRLLYAYPIGIDAELLGAISDLPRVCEYLDLPLQHSSERILKLMRRPLGRYAAREMVEMIRQTAPAVQLRTTFIVGFPGETEQDVADLEQLVGEGHFSSVGVFTYSPEAGTPAAEMENQIPQDERDVRRERIMLAQKGAVKRRMKSLVGERIEVLVEGAHDETDLLLSGRARFQAPEVDGTVIINEIAEGVEHANSGSIVQVEISGTAGYDLVGTLVGSI